MGRLVEMDDRLMPDGAREEYLETRFGRIRILRGIQEPHEGDGDDAPKRGLPLVLIHGGGYDNASISWYYVYEARRRAHEVVGIDLPGAGGSVDAEPVGGPAQMAEVASEVMDALGIDRAAIYGCSMGGDVALHLALARPEKVAALVLIGPGGLAPRVGGALIHRMSWLMARLPDWILMPMMRWASRFARYAQRLTLHDPSLLAPALVDEFIREAQHPRGGLAYLRYNQATLGRSRLLNDLSDRVGEIEAPTLFFHGARDRFVDPSGSARAHQSMPNARLVLVEDCGHWAQLEQPERFEAETRAFLEGVGE